MLNFMLIPRSGQPVHELLCNIRVGMRIEIKQVSLKWVEVHDVSGFLQDYVNKGYVLHGSNALCEVLEPRAGYCLTGLKENLQVAVYATISPLIAIFNAIRDHRRGYAHYELIRGYLCLEADEQTIASLGEGYVYVIDKGKFGKCRIEQGQFVSPEEVKPICVVKVTNRDLWYPIRLVNYVKRLDVEGSCHCTRRTSI
jgi:hypothetical protein